MQMSWIESNWSEMSFSVWAIMLRLCAAICYENFAFIIDNSEGKPLENDRWINKVLKQKKTSISIQNYVQNVLGLFVLILCFVLKWINFVDRNKSQWKRKTIYTCRIEQ